jgi:hypothetical protein
MTIVYALILPALALIPRGLIATRDGRENPEMEAVVPAEIARA